MGEKIVGLGLAQNQTKAKRRLAQFCHLELGLAESHTRVARSAPVRGANTYRGLILRQARDDGIKMQPVPSVR